MVAVMNSNAASHEAPTSFHSLPTFFPIVSYPSAFSSLTKVELESNIDEVSDIYAYRAKF